MTHPMTHYEHISRSTPNLDFTKGSDCDGDNEWCLYPEAHNHGSFACDESCPCRTAPDFYDWPKEQP